MIKNLIILYVFTLFFFSISCVSTRQLNPEVQVGQGCALIWDLEAQASWQTKATLSVPFGLEGIWSTQDASMNLDLLDPLMGIPLVSGIWTSDATGFKIKGPQSVLLQGVDNDFLQKLNSAMGFILPQHLQYILSGCVLHKSLKSYSVVFKNPKKDFVWEVERRDQVVASTGLTRVTLSGPLKVFFKELAHLEVQYAQGNWRSIKGVWNNGKQWLRLDAEHQDH